jgi:hypothetical protein
VKRELRRREVNESDLLILFIKRSPQVGSLTVRIASSVRWQSFDREHQRREQGNQSALVTSQPRLQQDRGLRITAKEFWSITKQTLHPGSRQID